MSRVNGLYGHIQRNNVKSVALFAAFLGLFVAINSIPFLAPYLTAHQPGLTNSERTAIQEAFSESLDNTVFERRLSVLEAATKSDADRAADVPAKAKKQAAIVEPPKSVDQLLWLRFKSSLPWILAAGILYVLVATWWNSLYIRYAMRARPLTRREHPALYNLVENLAITAADDAGVKNLAAQAMMFSGLADGWFSTHPPVDERIEALRQHVGITRDDEVKQWARDVKSTKAYLPSRAPALKPAQAAPSTFGRRQPRVVNKPNTPSFALEAASQSVRRENAVFEVPSRSDYTPASGNSWFERWVMSGALDGLGKTLKNPRIMQYVIATVVIAYQVMFRH